MGAEIDRLEIRVETEASNANKQLDLMIEKLNQVSKTLGGINFGNLNGMSDSVKSVGKSAQDSANKAQNFSNAMYSFAMRTGSSNTQLKKVSSTLGSYIAKTTLASNKSKNFSKTLYSVRASLFPVIRGMKSLGNAIESSMDYIETYNYFNVTMDKIGKEFSNQYEKYGYESAETYIDSFSSRLTNLTKKMTGYSVGRDGVLSLSNDMNLGIDPNQLMNYQTSVAAVTNSLGLCGETSVNTAKALSMLAADLSSFKNVDLNTVMTNMQSGLIGQSRALYKYGIDITNATLQTYAYKYGLSTAVSEMTQADKMQLRLLAILDQSKIAWGDQANTINSVANQYRILKQQIKNVARMIGNVLMPVVQAALPVINGLLIATQRLIGFIGGLLGIDFSKTMDGISSGYSGFDTGDMADDIESMSDSSKDVADNLGKASENAKKMKTAMLGIDELNVIQPNDDSDSGGQSSGTGISGIGSGGIDLSNEIASAFAEYESVWNKAFESSANKAQKYADKITNVFSNMWQMIRSEDFEGLGEYIASGVDFVFEKINAVFNWDKMGPVITEFIDGYCRTINSLVYNIDWQNIGKTIGDGINVIANSLYLYLIGIDWIAIGSALADGLNGMINSVDWEILGRAIGAWIMKIPKIIYGFVTTLDWAEVGTAIGSAINGVLIEFDGETIAEGINGVVNGILTVLSNIIKTVDWSEVAKSVGDVLGNLDWGGLAKVGLMLGATKLVGALGYLLSLAIPACIIGALKIGLSKAIPAIKNSKIGQVISLTKGGAGSLSESFATMFGTNLSTVSTYIGVIALLAAGIVDLWKTSETFRDNVQNMLSIIGAAFDDFKKKVWDEGLRPLWDSIAELFSSLYGLYESSGLKSVFEEIVTVIGYIASTAIGGLITVLGNFINYLLGIMKKAVDALNDLVGNIQKFVDDHEKLIGGLKKVYEGFTEFLSGVFSGDWKRAFEGIKTMASGFKDSIQDIFDRLWKKIKSIFSPVKTYFKDAFKSAYDAVKGVWNGIGSYFKGIANDIISPIGKAVNGIIGGVNWVLDKVGSNKRLSEWTVPKFARGANGLPKDTLGMVNDQKGSTYRELIVPPDGKAFIPEGRNVMLPLQKGTKIMPADETKALMSAFPHFAGGIGDFFGSAWAKFKDFTGNVLDYITHPDKIVQIALDKFVDISNMVEPISSIAKGAVDTVFGGIVDYIKGIFDSETTVKYNPSAGVEQWRNLATKALQMTGQFTEANLNRLLYQMQTESGGNPNAINNWDINAKNGIPSKGLMQVIDPTFRAYAYPGYNTNIYDPLSNMLAAIRYTVSRYGSLAKGWNGHGYASGIGRIKFSDFIPHLADGGVLKSGQMFIARERGPELVGRHGNKSTVINNDQIVQSVSNGVELAVERQNARTNALLQQIAEYQRQLLDKETSVNIDGKKADKQLSKARKNSGYSFSPA